MPTQQEIMATQGTRLSSRAPWETYAEELEVKMTPELAAEVADYATRFHDGEGTNQAREELAMRKEMNDASVNEYKWATEEEYADIQARIGRILHHSEFISRLRKIGVRCWFSEHPHLDKLTFLVQRNADVMLKPEVLCFAQRGYAPEFTVMGFDDHGVPLAERYRGWRTVLLRLIMSKLVTEERAHKEFGRVERRCGDRYNSVLHGLRNTVIE